jgi:hypothetical protein
MDGPTVDESRRGERLVVQEVPAKKRDDQLLLMALVAGIFLLAVSVALMTGIWFMYAREGAP